MTEQETKMLTKPKFDIILKKVTYGVLGTTLLYCLYNLLFEVAVTGDNLLFIAGGLSLAMVLWIVYMVRDLKQVTPIYKDIMKKLKEREI